MDAFASNIENLCTAAQPLVVVLVIASLMIIGIMLIVPSERIHHTALKALPFVLLGSAISLGAVTLGKWVTSNITF